MKIFVIACEPSGDLHGAHLVEELKKVEPDLECRGLGGPKMAAAGVSLLTDMTQISALGFGDVLRRYFTYRKIFYRALEDARRFKPDALVLIDSPAFNLRFAKKINREFPVLYYIAPQIWAWGARRIRTIKKTVSKMLVILPFEVPIYEKAGVPCEFTGHPLLDQIPEPADREALRKRLGIPPGRRAVGLFAGSRESEVRRILPLMLRTAARLKEKLPETVFFLHRSENISQALYQSLCPSPSPLPLGERDRVRGETDCEIRHSEIPFYDLVRAVDFALVTSGTATLEAALLGTPFFLFYKAGWSTYFLGKYLVRVPYLGLVNLLAGKSVVPEFIQGNIRPGLVAQEAAAFLENRGRYEAMKREFTAVREKLGQKGAGARAARAVTAFLREGTAR